MERGVKSGVECEVKKRGGMWSGMWGEVGGWGGGISRGWRRNSVGCGGFRRIFRDKRIKREVFSSQKNMMKNIDATRKHVCPTKLFFFIVIIYRVPGL